jgi:EAL domain-containing protein (putative c-di-GMP-specific phosphodiesterase class I)
MDEEETAWAEAIGRTRSRILQVIDDQQLRIAHQPVFDLVDERVAGVECLSRFDSTPRRPPDVWFAEAAQCGLGRELEFAALSLALPAHRALQAPVYLSLNLSAPLLAHADLAAMLSSVAPDRVVLEVANGEGVETHSASDAVLELRARGVRLAIDDAQGDYESLRRMEFVRPDMIKLDASLVRSVDLDGAKRALVRMLAGFARENEAVLVAKAVETASELATLRKLGVTHAQGYVLAKPMPLDDAAQLCAGQPHGQKLLNVNMMPRLTIS